jgi:hypothetical protein
MPTLRSIAAQINAMSDSPEKSAKRHQLQILREAKAFHRAARRELRKQVAQKAREGS